VCGRGWVSVTVCMPIAVLSGESSRVVCEGETRGAFHLAKNLGNFGRKSNGKAGFGSVRPEYSGPPLEVVQFDHLPFHFAKPVHFPSSL